VKELKPSNFEPLLKEDLACFRCRAEMKNMPILKSHLQEEWDKLERRAKQIQSRKRKFKEIEIVSSASEKENTKELSEESSSKQATSPDERPNVGDSRVGSKGNPIAL